MLKKSDSGEDRSNILLLLQQHDVASFPLVNSIQVTQLDK